MSRHPMWHMSRLQFDTKAQQQRTAVHVLHGSVAPTLRSLLCSCEVFTYVVVEELVSRFLGRITPSAQLFVSGFLERTRLRPIRREPNRASFADKIALKIASSRLRVPFDLPSSRRRAIYDSIVSAVMSAMDRSPKSSSIRLRLDRHPLRVLSLHWHPLST